VVAGGRLLVTSLYEGGGAEGAERANGETAAGADTTAAGADTAAAGADTTAAGADTTGTGTCDCSCNLC